MQVNQRRGAAASAAGGTASSNSGAYFGASSGGAAGGSDGEPTDHHQHHHQHATVSSISTLPSSSSSAAAIAPGRTVKMRRAARTKRSHRRSAGKGITRAMVLLGGCLVATVLVSIAVWIGSKVAGALGRRRGQKGTSSSRYYTASRSSNSAVKSASLISIDPGEYNMVSWATKQDAAGSTASDEHGGAGLYRPHDSMPGLGDFSPRYAKLREEVDQLLPDDLERSLSRIEELTTHKFELIPMEPTKDFAQGEPGRDQVPYDIYNCPDEPPENYPYQWKLTKLLNHWPTLDPEPRRQVHHGLCVFDYNVDYEKAMRYRNAELPFITINDPAVVKTVERWSIPGYVEAMLGERPYGCEEMSSVHFMYGSASKPKKRKAAAAAEGEADKKFYTPPKHVLMRYSEWEKHANVPDDQLGPDMPHWYFRLITCGKFRGDVCRKTGEYGSEYILDELTFFQPKENLYMVDPGAQAGIHCRFGMKGLIAENHWDSGRNSIVVLRGMRRYILAHPRECPNLVLYPKGHPSARHSKMDWAHYDVDAYPEFANATANEVVMQPGHVLFLPATWFHYIISLDTNMQCNTRSGNSADWNKWVKQCGF